MKYLNIVLVLFLILCSWAISAIGFGLDFLLIDVGDSCSTDIVAKVNDVFKNLSYSYFAGFIMYVLTVIIPQHKRSKNMKPLVNNSINEYYSIALHVFWRFYTAANIKGVDIDVNENIKYYTQGVTDVNKRLIANFANTGDAGFLFKGLAHLQKSYNSFLLNMVSCEEHLTDKQLTILNKIRISNLLYSIEPYEDLITMSPEVDLVFYEEFNSYISEIVALKKTV